MRNQRTATPPHAMIALASRPTLSANHPSWHGNHMRLARIHRSAPDDERRLEPWLQRMVDFVHTETTPTTLPHVPGITLRLAPESVPLWGRIEDELGPGPGPPYWAFAWAGGLALARHVMDHPELVAGRRVLDFASGCGLTAIAAAMSGAAHVIATDTDPLAVVALSLNADANGVTIQASAADLLAETAFDPANIDVVLAGDAFYDPSIADRVLAFLASCRAAGCEVLIGDPGRAHLPVACLKRISAQEVPVTRGYEYVAAVPDYELHAATVWRLVA
jgi:predicted nicotinamide N-methyase